MLNKINTLLFRVCIGLWILYALSKPLDLLGRAERWGCLSDQFPTVCCLSLVILILGWKFVFPVRERTDAIRTAKIINREFLWFPIVSRLALSFGVCFTSFLIIFFCRYSSDNLTLPLAIAADKLGNYELAERIFRYRLDRWDRRVPFAAWKSSFFPAESWEDRIHRNVAVASVFGTESLEMANRLFYCAANVDMSTAGADSTLLCQRYFKALALYEKNHFANGEEKCFNGILVNTENSSVGDKRCLIFRAHARLYETQPSRLWSCLDVLAWEARQVGLADIAADFSRRSQELTEISNSIDDHNVWTGVYVVCAMLFVLLNGTGFLQFWHRTCLLKRAYRRIEKKTRNITTGMVAVELLANMIEIDLLLGNLSRANSNSMKLMGLVGERCSGSSYLIENVSGMRLRKPVFLQIHAFAFTSLLLYSFV